MYHHLSEAARDFLSVYRYKIELHTHTSPCSECGEISPKDLIDRMQKQHYDAVVITNHFYGAASFMREADPVAAYLKDYYEALEEGREKGVRVFLGAEYRFTEGPNDYLIFGVDEAFLRDTVYQLDMGIKAFYREYHKENLLIVQAHPFRDGMVFAGMDCLDGIETMNLHPSHNSRVGVTVQYATEVQKATAEDQKYPVVTIGTDLHHAGHEGISALRTRILPENEAHLVEILRSKDYLFEIGGCLMLPYSYKVLND